MELGLQNKRVLVTGSTGGIGAGIDQKFTEEGAAVVIHGRRAEAAGQVATSKREAGGKVIVAMDDLTSDKAANRVVEVELSISPGRTLSRQPAGQSCLRGQYPCRWRFRTNGELAILGPEAFCHLLTGCRRRRRYNLERLFRHRDR